MKKKLDSAKGNIPVIKKSSIGSEEKDIDDLVHEETGQQDLAQNEEDPDDKVHQAKKSVMPPKDQAGTGMEDPDDLVHGYSAEEEN